MIIDLVPREDFVFDPSQGSVSESFQENEVVAVLINGVKEDYEFRPNYDFTVLAVGCSVPHALVNGETLPFVTLGAVNDSGPFFSAQVPFLPSSNTVGENHVIKSESDVDAVALEMVFSWSISTVGLPSDLDGREIPIFPFVKIDIDKRALRRPS